jgi:hypothetical protein
MRGRPETASSTPVLGRQSHQTADRRRLDVVHRAGGTNPEAAPTSPEKVPLPSQVVRGCSRLASEVTGGRDILWSVTSSWDPDLPDPSLWQPSQSPEALKASFRNRCLGVERLILLRAELERGMNINNFDSGPGVEDIFREELRRLLPDRYSVRPGVISNSDGFNAGDCDVVIFNHIWFPSVKAGAGPESRRFHYPVEGVYGVLEVKQSLSSVTLDAAMEKLVTVARVAPSPYRHLMVENRGYMQDVDSQPMFKAIVAAGLGRGEDLRDLVHRFVALNGQLARREVVNALCVLGDGYASWVYGEPPAAAYFGANESTEHLSPVLLEVKGDSEVSALYELITNLLGHLTSQVLPANDVAVKYGAPQKAIRPTNHDWDLHPDSCTCSTQDS